MTEAKAYLRAGVLFGLAILAWSTTRSILWVPLFLLSAFFFAVDVFSVGKLPERKLDMDKERSDTPLGKLGNFVVDRTPSYGLFVELRGHSVFVDLREDSHLQARAERAALLFRMSALLEQSLERFIAANPEFQTRRVSYIGLHSERMLEADVFWEPEGHTVLRDMEFILD